MLVKKVIAGPTRIDLNQESLTALFRDVQRGMVESIARVSESYTNEVYRIRLDSGESYYLKFFDDEFHADRAKAELRAIEEARKLGVPVPEVVCNGFSRASFKRDFALFSEVPGRELRQEKINPSLLSSCFDALEKIHSLKNTDYGFLYLPQQHWEKGRCYFDFLSDVIGYGIKKLEKEGYVIDGLYDLYCAHKGKIKENDYCLNHNDFTAKHIFTNGTSITGLIDWEWNAFVNPLNDYTIFLNSLLDEGISQTIALQILDRLKSQFDNFEEINFYMGGRFLLGAIFPHRNKLAKRFVRRKLLFGKLLLKKEITLEEFVRDIYERSTFIR